MRDGGITVSAEAPFGAVLALKRCKRSSSLSTAAATSIDDLPGNLLVEILCRLSCNKLVGQCKCVSKRWCSLLSDPYVIGRFLGVQRDKKQQQQQLPTSLPTLLINSKGEEFLAASLMSSSEEVWGKRFCVSNFLPPWREEKPVLVVATYKDLVLCRAGRGDQHVDHYYICNPYLKRWVALPPTPARSHRMPVPVGLICDPYYEEEEEKQIIKMNPAYRSLVVRIHPLHNSKICFFPKFKVEIFSFDTGEWTDSIVSSPPVVSRCICTDFSFAFNGKLYWLTDDSNIFIGLDPFMINSSSNGDHNYQCHIIECDTPWPEYGPYLLDFLGVSKRGCLRICHLHLPTKSLVVWELSKQAQVAAVANGKLCLKHTRVYSLDPKMFPDNDLDAFVHLLNFDPSDDDILYLRLHCNTIFYRCNIRTRG